MFIRLLLVVLVILISNRTPIHALSAADATAALKRLDRSIQTIRADFSLTETPTGATGYEIVQRGTYLQKGNDLSKIDFRFPHFQTTLIRGNQATIAYQDRSERSQETLENAPHQFLTRAIGALLRPASLLPYLQISVTGKMGERWMVTGTPTSLDAPFGRVQYLLSEGTLLPVRRNVYNLKGRLSQVTQYYYEKVGNTQVPARISALFPGSGGSRMVELKLENLQINRPIADEEFVIPY